MLRHSAFELIKAFTFSKKSTNLKHDCFLDGN